MPDFIFETTRGQGVLFNIDKSELVDNGPIMNGSVEINNNKYYINGFLHHSRTEGGKDYLGIQISEPLPENFTEDDLDNQIRYHGKLFRQSNKLNSDSPDYTGFIQILPVTRSAEKYSPEQWDAAPQLLVVGYARRNAGDGKARISLSFMPKEIASGELAF